MHSATTSHYQYLNKKCNTRYTNLHLVAATTSLDVTSRGGFTTMFC